MENLGAVECGTVRYTECLILTLTINPALDRNVMVDRLAFEDRGYILSTSESPGGRGINASRVIHSFGGETVAIATTGGATGKRFESLTDCCNFPMELVRTEQEMRTNLTITDKQGLTVKLNEVGAPLSAKSLGKIAAAVEKNLSKSSWFMICGSVPPGVASHFYKDLIELAHKKKVRTLLDTDGDALLHGLEASPTVVTPNQQEAERLLNRALITRTHLIDVDVLLACLHVGCEVPVGHLLHRRLAVGRRHAVGEKLTITTMSYSRGPLPRPMRRRG